MTARYHELLLSELRMAAYLPGDPADMTDELLCKAVTLNENLQCLGFVLRPDDVLRLSVSASLDSFYDDLSALVPKVRAEPMYPGFPQQVMQMSEAEFRLHQMMHYFSTYGVELLLGTEVQRGWLPEAKAQERTDRDTRLLEARVIELVPADDVPFTALRTLLDRRERLTNPELELVLESAPLCTAEQLQGLKVRFKENLELLFPLLVRESDRETALHTLRALCAHSGDVLRCATDYLRSRRFHLRTAEKRLLVKLLERYPVENLRENLILSQRVRERNLLVLQYLDYNMYSRSAEHREAVRALRNSELQSWRGQAEAPLSKHTPEALAFLAQRPGYMVRMLNRLLSLGYAQDAIEAALLPQAGAISAHLLVKCIRALSRRGAELEERHRSELLVYSVRHRRQIFKKVPDCVPRWVTLHCNAEARRRAVRWKCMEARLSSAQERAYAPLRPMLEALEARERELKDQAAILERMDSLADVRQSAVIRQNANARIDRLQLLAQMNKKDPGKLRANVERLLREVPEARKAYARRKRTVDDRLAQELARIKAEMASSCADALREIDRWEQEEKRKLRLHHEQEIKAHLQAQRTVSACQKAELAAIEERYVHARKMFPYDAQSVNILKALLREHFRLAGTPLRGKRVCFDLGQFDLANSTLETGDRSQDGGYIRSGISYRIPKGARYVRFFVYWNDPNRVDVDLHAGGKLLTGEDLHVGWNASYQDNGVVHSGDITHSNAAEYIDIDLSMPIKEIYANVDLFYGQNCFSDVETCYIGLMAVDQIGQNIRHYDPANCFFTHTLSQKTRSLFYGFIDVQNRFVRFIGQPDRASWAARPALEPKGSMYSLQDYLDCVLTAQGAERVASQDEADVVLTMGKSALENGVSLVDSNFFLEC